MMDIGDAKELKKLLAKIATEQPPINPLVSAHIDQICRHHRDHGVSDITIGIIIAINETQHAGLNPDTTTELIWRLIYACSQLEKIRP
jgi:hypothetical protein